MFFPGMLGFISTFICLPYWVSVQSPSHKPIWQLPLPTTGRSQPFCQRRGGVCGGREGEAGAAVRARWPWRASSSLGCLIVHGSLAETFSAPLSQLFSSQINGQYLL